MKKLLLVVLALAMATPVIANQVIAYDKGGGVVDVNYIMSTGDKRVRAFGLDVTITSPMTIDSIDGYKTNGASTGTSRGYGIFPSNIVIDETGAFQSSGSPVSTKLPAGTQPGLLSQGVTLELGSLYAPTTTDANAPVVTAGGQIKLCTLHINAHGAASGTLSIALNTARGGIVYEDTTTTPVTTLTGTTVSFVTIPNPPTSVVATDGAFTAKCVVSWAASSGATAYDVYRFTSNNSASAVKVGSDVAASPWNDTTVPVGQTNYYWVKAKNTAGVSGFSTSDSGNRLASGGTLTAGQIFVLTGLTPSTLSVTAAMVTNWNNAGQPKCWTCLGQKLGNGVLIGSTRTDSFDLAAVKAGWMKTGTQAGYLPCSDHNLSNRIDSFDLSVVKGKWMVTVGNSGCL